MNWEGAPFPAFFLDGIIDPCYGIHRTNRLQSGSTWRTATATQTHILAGEHDARKSIIRSRETNPIGTSGGRLRIGDWGFAAAGAWDVKRSQFAGMPGERPGPGAPNEPNFPPWRPRNGLRAPNEANWSEPEARDWGFAARETRDARRTQLARFLRPPASAAPRATRKTKPIGGGECGIMALSCYFEVL